MNKIVSTVVVTLVFIGFYQPMVAENTSLTFLNRILSSADKESDKALLRLAGGRLLLPDDPANYAIYEMLEKHIRGLERTVGNRADMISYYQMEDSLLGNVLEILRRIRDLILQKSNSILSDSDKAIIDSEIRMQYDQVVYTLEQSEFNKKKLFADLMKSDLIKSRFGQAEYYQRRSVDQLMDFFVLERTTIGSRIKVLEYAASGERVARENISEVQGHGDTDFGIETSNLKRSGLLLLINVLMLKRDVK